MHEIIGIDTLVNWVHERKCSFWKAYDSDVTKSRNAMGSNMEMKDPTIEDCERSLRSFVSKFDNLHCYIWITNSVKAANSGYYVWFTQPSRSGLNHNNNQISGIPAGYVQEDKVNEMIQKALTEMTTRQKIEQLEKENLELRKENKSLAVQETSVDRFIGTITPYVPLFMKSAGYDIPAVNQIVSAVAGSDDPSSKTQEYKDEKIAQALNKLDSMYPNLEDILEKLASTDKSKLDIGLSML
jgi:hypothetical protein